MTRLVLAASIVLALALPAVARPANPILVAKVGLHDRYTITLTLPNGQTMNGTFVVRP